MPTLNAVTVGKFIRELVAGVDTTSVLMQEWGLSADDYLELKKTPAFQQELARAIAEMQAQGPDASYILRMKMVSEEFIGDIINLVKDPITPHSVKADLIKFAADMARLKPEKKSDAPTGTSVVFNFGGSVGKLLDIEGRTLSVQKAIE